MKPKVLSIVGPTASGKSRLALALCKAFDGELVSVDSMQVYQGLDIGTAKPSLEEQQAVPHHLIDCASLSESYNLARFLEEAAAAVADISARGKLPVLCGGTGLYMDTLLSGMPLFESSSDPALREKLEAQDSDALHRELASLDSSAAARIHPNNRRKVIRALELLYSGETPRAAFAEPAEQPYQVCSMGLTYSDRALLYAAIDRRVEVMIAQGLLSEVERLFSDKHPSETALQAIGYKEFLPYFSGEGTLDASISLLKQESRRYAKRQLTWFKRNKGIHWYFVDTYKDFSDIIESSTKFVDFFLNNQA